MHTPRVSAYSAKFVGIALLLVAQGQAQQQISDFERERAQQMLQTIAKDVRHHYYDPTFHGLDWDAKVAEAKEKIAKTTSMNMAMSHIAALLDTLDDSHTFFLPPGPTTRSDYGWQDEMIGERCFVTRVRPKSDAEEKGVKPGDEILTINGFTPTRDNLWKMQFVFSALRPQRGLRLGLQDSAGSQRKVDVMAKVHQGDIFYLLRELQLARERMRARSEEFGQQLIVLKVPIFGLSTVTEVDDMFGKIRKHPALIVDLRGNLGGATETLRDLMGRMFDKDVKIADRAGRKETRPEVAKGGHHEFSGKLVVLVDAESASAAELFARVIQIEKRGIVVGDHSSGRVMESKHYIEGTYGASITEWDLIMTDGKSLEHTGVTPDEIVLPSAEDLAAGRDPAMARAAELLGVKVSPEEAGKLFPYEWPPE
ncbi:MAG: S41 family peptidase [Candidatus Sulfotelmatobacter sp.]|jgi:carboxyl-terminal processing protease